MLENTTMILIFLAAVICLMGMVIIYTLYLERDEEQRVADLGVKTEVALGKFWRAIDAVKDMKNEVIKEEFERFPLDNGKE